MFSVNLSVSDKVNVKINEDDVGTNCFLLQMNARLDTLDKVSENFDDILEG